MYDSKKDKKMKLYNTLTRKLDEFEPINPELVKMYCCGPTVYSYAHVGNLRAYLTQDFLKKTLKRAGYNVMHVMNITDVGHLTGDSDEGDDKMLLAAERERKGVIEIARFYEDVFFRNCEDLNIERPNIVSRATEHIRDMIDFIQKLERKGFAYKAGGNVYFDTQKFEKYGDMARLDIENLRHGARVIEDDNKKSPTDFVLWFTSSKFENQILQWDSPWGRGYPGWHIECSAMATKYLGEFIDIHCGGVDHIPVHHTNEIAQSEACFAHKWVNYWIHNEFLQLKNMKMGKSHGNIITVDTLKEKGYDPLSLRYLCLTAHYRSTLIFSFENLDAAQNAYNNLKSKILVLKKENSNRVDTKKLLEIIEKFNSFIFEDVGTPKALAFMWDILKNKNIDSSTKLAAILQMDNVFSLNLENVKENQILVDKEIEDLLKNRKLARDNKDWKRSDEIRDLLAKKGFLAKDMPTGQTILESIKVKTN
jgi:cysteinyl-tRNA synthetase